MQCSLSCPTACCLFKMPVCWRLSEPNCSCLCPSRFDPARTHLSSACRGSLAACGGPVCSCCCCMCRPACCCLPGWLALPPAGASIVTVAAVLWLPFLPIFLHPVIITIPCGATGTVSGKDMGAQGYCQHAAFVARLLAVHTQPIGTP
jgi:hypothetical protein